ncbi:MAG: N-acetylglucosamine-6-sulfatase, partial [Pseudohongiellaceae bacterium]
MQSHLILGVCLLSALLVNCSNEEDPLRLEPLANASPKNVVYILSDDHRFDFMGFTGKVPWL